MSIQSNVHVVAIGIAAATEFAVGSAPRRHPPAPPAGGRVAGVDVSDARRRTHVRRAFPQRISTCL
eukprot:511133-Prymnesium_polylepis.2